MTTEIKKAGKTYPTPEEIIKKMDAISKGLKRELNKYHADIYLLDNMVLDCKGATEEQKAEMHRSLDKLIEIIKDFVK